MIEFNKELFINEIKDLISQIEKVNNDGIYDKVISELSENLSSIKIDAENVDGNEFLSLHYYINLLIDAADSKDFNDIRQSISIISCIAIIINNGLVQFSDFKYPLCISNSCMRKIANILGSQVTYDINHFIVSDAYLEECLCALPSY